MTSEKEVEVFLKDFIQKMKIWDVFFRDDRGKNIQTLADLEINPLERKKYLENLQIKDYCDGPRLENLNGGADMWVFGKTIKKKEVYIKITLGLIGAGVICISFHLAERKMHYPLK